MRINSLLTVIIIILGISMTSNSVLIQCAYADSLLDMYELARINDADIQAAESNYYSEIQLKPIAKANLFPKADVTAFSADVRQKTNGFTFGIIGGDVDFNEHGYLLTIRQALYHHDFYVQLKQAKNLVAKARVDLDASYQALMVRVAEAYLNVLAAQDELNFRISEKEAISRQLIRAKGQFESGLNAITDVQEAQASFDFAKANEIIADNNLITAKNLIEIIIATRIDKFDGLSDRMELVTPEPNNVEAWINKALEHNLNHLSSKYDIEISRQELNLRRSLYYPTLDIVASHSDLDTDGLTGSFGFEDTRIGVELNLPIFEGGKRYYQKKQANYDVITAQKLHEKSRRVITQKTRTAFQDVVTSIKTVKALHQTLQSTSVAAQSAETGFKIGIRTSVDVLLALRERYRANRDYSQARYDYLLSILKLKQASGILTVDDLEMLDAWLK